MRENLFSHPIIPGFSLRFHVGVSAVDRVSRLVLGSTNGVGWIGEHGCAPGVEHSNIEQLPATSCPGLSLVPLGWKKPSAITRLCYSRVSKVVLNDADEKLTFG